MLDFCKAQFAGLLRLRRDDRGVTAMEYGLIAALVAVVVIGGLTTIGTSLETKFESIATALK